MAWALGRGAPAAKPRCWIAPRSAGWAATPPSIMPTEARPGRPPWASSAAPAAAAAATPLWPCRWLAANSPARGEPPQPRQRPVDRPAARHPQLDLADVEPLDPFLGDPGEARRLGRGEARRIGIERDHLAAHGRAEIGHLQRVAIGADQRFQPVDARIGELAGGGADVRRAA